MLDLVCLADVIKSPSVNISGGGGEVGFVGEDEVQPDFHSRR